MDENFLEKAGEGDICFVENQSLKGTEGRIEKLIVFGWNRAYPFDLKLDLDLNQMEKTAEEEFAGYSHEKITRLQYRKKGLKKMKDNRKKRKRFLPIWFLLIALLIGGCGSETESRQTDAIMQQTLTETADTLEETQEQRAVVASDETESAAKTQDEITDYATEKSSVLTMEEIPAFADAPYVVIDDNEPDFQESDYSETSYEYYSDLDELGRCGVAVSNIGKDLMPTKKRGSIGKVKPSGWHTVKYDFVDGKYLYNRCHLIGYQLTAENANEKNLITGTRYMNVDGMLPFENMVADYIKETGNHVLYRVTPIYTGDNLVADGVEMEARSVEDDGDGICYHVFVYNEQPGVAIDHATGESHLAENAEVYASQAESGDERAEEVQTEAPAEQTQVQEQAAAASEYILNTNTMKFHRPSCSSVNQMSDSNKWVYDGTREEVLNMGYEPCKRCNP